MRVLLILAIVLAPVLSSADQSGVYFTEGLIGYTLSFNQSPTAVTSRTLGSSQTGLGYIIGGWFFLGGMFNYTILNETTSDAGNNNTNHQQTYEYYGPSIGYIGDNWLLIIDYLAYAEQKDNVSGASGSYTTDRTGSGFGVDLTYRFDLGTFDFGPMLSLKNVNYQNCLNPSTGATSSCNPTITQFEILPYFQFLVNFK